MSLRVDRPRRIIPVLAALTLVGCLVAQSPAVEPAADEFSGGMSATSRPATPPSAGVIRSALLQLYTRPRAQTPSPQTGAAARQAVVAPVRPASQPAAETPTAPPAADPSSSQGYFVPGYGFYSTEQPSRLPHHTREWSEYRYFGGKPSRYGHGRYNRSLPGGGNNVGGDYFRFGFVEGYDAGKFDRASNERVQAVMRVANLHLDRGLQLFNQGQYAPAADAFRVAADKDQGDAIARLYAAHSLFAVGRYREATPYLRRAFELQPHILFLNYDMRGDYGNPAEFDAQLAALRKALQISPTDPDRLLMLGYVFYYSQQRPAAFAVLDRLCQIDRADALAHRLRDNARPSDVEMDALQSQAIVQPNPKR